MKSQLCTTLILLCCASSSITLPAQHTATPAVTPAATTVTTTGGASGTIPYFNGTSTVLPSTLYFNSTGLGVGKLPGGALDVNGKAIFRGSLNATRAGDATTATGYNSYPLVFQASVYNSSNKTVNTPTFQLQAEVTGNNTATNGATFNFLSGSNETGLYFNSNGTIHFSPQQTFPVAAGPTGPQGPQGPAGPSGPTGPAGPAGLNTLQLFTSTSLLQPFTDNVDQFGAIMGISNGTTASDYYGQQRASLILQKACTASKLSVNLRYESITFPFIMTTTVLISGTKTPMACDTGYASGTNFSCISSGTYAIPAGSLVTLDFSHTGTNPSNIYPQVTFQCQ